MLTLLACAIVAVAQHDQNMVLVVIMLLGIGWSAILVGSSAQLVTASPTNSRANFQGRSDLVMNICGAAGGLLAGPIVSATGLGFLAAAVGIAIAIQVTLTQLLVSRSSRRAAESAVA